MKTKNFLFLTFTFAIFLVFSASGQTSQQKKTIKQINQKLAQLSELRQIALKFESTESPSTADGYKRLLERKQRKFALYFKGSQQIDSAIFSLQTQRNEIEGSFFFRSIQNEVPTELRRSDKIQRERSLEVQSQEISLARQRAGLEKLQNSPIKGDSINGYEVLLWNQHATKYVNFIIQGSSNKEVDGESAHLKSGDKLVIHLLPGTYRVKIEIPGRIPDIKILNVSPRKAYIDGRHYHGYVVQPNY